MLQLVISEFNQHQSLKSCWSCQLLLFLHFFKYSYVLKVPPYLFNFTILFQFLYHSWGHSTRQSLIVSVCFLYAAFVHIGCWLFLVIKCLVVVTPGITIAFLFSLIPMCKGTLISVIFLSCASSSDRMSYIWFSIGWFSLLYSMNCIELWESVYIFHLLSSLLYSSKTIN